MKQEARSNLFVVAGTLFFFSSFLAAAKIKRKERRGGKMKRKSGTNMRRPSQREPRTSMVIVWGLKIY